jgi:succinyl-diaminopimelate desuccinylase
MGKRIIPVGSGGANDGSEFSRAKGNFMSVVIGPGSDTAHEPDEYISITQYLQSVDFYKEFAVAFLNERK